MGSVFIREGWLLKRSHIGIPAEMATESPAQHKELREPAANIS